MILAKMEIELKSINIFAYIHFATEIAFKKMEFERFSVHCNADNLIRFFTHDFISFFNINRI
jgi:hypothetical protein